MRMKKILLVLCVIALTSSIATADVVYVTARPQPSGAGPNPDPSYNEFTSDGGTSAVNGDTSSKSAAAAPVAPSGGSRYYVNAAPLTDTSRGFALNPTLAVPGGVYQIHSAISSTAGNVNTNAIFSVACTNGDMSVASTDKFQRQYGSPNTQWALIGFVTNNPGSATPWIDFRYQSGYISATAPGWRFLIDTFRFTLATPCLSVATIKVSGPLSANSNQVVVTDVSAVATNVNVYQDSGSGMVLLGSKTSGVTAGNNTVTVSGLVKGAQVAATQTITGQEGCVPTTGTFVGGGANPRVRIVYSIRETSSTGPVGANGISTSANIHFLGASNVVGGSPGSGPVLIPSSVWQTVTLQRGPGESIADSANAAGASADGSGYAALDAVTLQVFAFRTLHGVTIYSATAAQSAPVASNDVFKVSWTWDAVAGAQGYRLLRDLNSGGYNDSVDVAVNNYSDDNTGWISGNDVTLKTTQTDSSIQWSPTVSNPDSIPGQWGIFESINFAIDDLSDTGPYDLYIDNLKNGSTVWQTFEGSVAGTQEVTFKVPSNSGTTSDRILPTPNQSIISNGAADEGTKSLRIRFQWNNTNSDRWLRLTTTGSNPQVNLDDPISIRFLLLPVNTTPVAPPAPTISYSIVAGQLVLNWPDAHRLQASSLVTGIYTNVPGITTSPWINTFTEPQKFFRLVD